ncbi:MAG: YceD family protein [Pseudomonadota bacterium]
MDTTQLPSLTIRAEEVTKPRQVRLILDDNETSALALRLGLPGVESFTFVGQVEKIGSAQLRLTGTLTADVVYQCRRTSRTFESGIDEVLDQVFAPGAPASASTTEFDPNSDIDIDGLVDGTLDVAEYLYQSLSLMLDDYPEHPDAPGIMPADPMAAINADDETERQSPFAALEALKSKLH